MYGFEDDDDEEVLIEGAYEDGFWAWDNSTNSLQFTSCSNPVTSSEVPLVGAALVEEAQMGSFQCEMDVLEQSRYRRRYLRKGDPEVIDVVTLQDLKDLAIYTAPVNILNPMIVRMLHTNTTERFLRALILYCGYYLQIRDVMAVRKKEMQTKIRTDQSNIVEANYRNDLADLRVLVGSEYCLMLLGTKEIKKCHHMGPENSERSLTDQDAHFYESLIRFSVQIVWLALARSSYDIIEVEVHRLFKSQRYNMAESKLKTKHHASMSFYERKVLLGQCVKKGGKLIARSPLMEAVYCHRPIDFRLTGIGVIKFEKMSPRHEYFLMAITGPEDELVKKSVSLGILGLPRERFDTMLHLLPTQTDKRTSIACRSSFGSLFSRRSITSMKKTTSTKKICPQIVLPKKTPEDEYFPTSFPTQLETPPPIDQTQNLRWLTRLKKLKLY